MHHQGIQRNNPGRLREPSMSDHCTTVLHATGVRTVRKPTSAVGLASLNDAACSASGHCPLSAHSKTLPTVFRNRVHALSPPFPMSSTLDIERCKVRKQLSPIQPYSPRLAHLSCSAHHSAPNRLALPTLHVQCKKQTMLVWVRVDACMAQCGRPWYASS